MSLSNNLPSISPEAASTRNNERRGLNSVLQKNRTRFNNIMELFDINISEKTCQSVSRFAMEKLLWTVIIVVGTYFTVTMCFDLLHSYRNDPPHSKITVLKNETAVLPSVKVCLPIYTKPYLRNEAATMSYLEAVSNYLKGPNNVSAESFLGTDLWPKSFLHVAHEYLAFLTDTQIYTGAAGFERYKENSPDQWQSFLAIEQYLIESSVAIDQLEQKFGRDIMRLYDMQSTLYWYNNDTETNFSFEETLAVSNELLCTKSEPHVPFDTNDPHNIFINFDRTNVLSAQPNASFPKVQVLYSMIDAALFDITGFSETDVAFGYDTRIRLSLVAEYRSLPEVNGVKKCSMTTPNQSCRSRCRADYIRKTCGCEPMAWPELPSTEKRYCSLEKLAACQLSPDVGFSNCSLVYTCLNFCTQGGYTTAVSTTPLVDTRAEIYLQFDGMFFYPLYEETWPWTIESFVGAFGGVLGLCYFRSQMVIKEDVDGGKAGSNKGDHCESNGLWLGLDILVLLKLLLTLIGFCTRVCQRMYDKEKTSRSTEKEKTDICGLEIGENKGHPALAR